MTIFDVLNLIGGLCLFLFGPDICFSGDTNGHPSAILGIKISYRVIHGIASALTERNDDFVLQGSLGVHTSYPHDMIRIV